MLKKMWIVWVFLWDFELLYVNFVFYLWSLLSWCIFKTIYLSAIFCCDPLLHVLRYLFSSQTKPNWSLQLRSLISLVFSYSCIQFSAFLALSGLPYFQTTGLPFEIQVNLRWAPIPPNQRWGGERLLKLYRAPNKIYNSYSAAQYYTYNLPLIKIL